MISYKLNEKVYRLPLGDLYSDKFSNYLNGDVISFDNVATIDELYFLTNDLFGWVSRSLCVMEDEYLNPERLVEKEEIRRKMDHIDRLQRFAVKQGKKDKAIEIINRFMEEMLEHFRKSLEDDEPRLGGK